VNTSGEDSKSGCAPEEALALAQAVAKLPRLKLRGIMALPAPSPDPAVQHEALKQVRTHFSQWQAAGLDVDTVSMGMSNDLEAAVQEGATMVRIGTAIFGHR
jgi:pyridoxal phosphate enzyme (YggS family)